MMIGRWGFVLSSIVGAVFVGRLIRDAPYLLPNRLPGLVIYELGPGLLLGMAIGTALLTTSQDNSRLHGPKRLTIFMATALIAAIIAVSMSFDSALRGRWI